MSDKEKIRAEIEKRYNERDRIGDNIRANVHKSLISFIDSMQEEPVSESINFEKELYKAFGQVKDFTLGMRIAKWFYDIGKKSREPVNKQNLSNVERTVKDWKEEPVSEDLGDYINELSKQFPEVSFAKLSRIAVRVAKWQIEQINEVLLSEVLPCFMHGGEADEVVAKLDEVLNKK